VVVVVVVVAVCHCSETPWWTKRGALFFLPVIVVVCVCVCAFARGHKKRISHFKFAAAVCCFRTTPSNVMRRVKKETIDGRRSEIRAMKRSRDEENRGEEASVSFLRVLYVRYPKIVFVILDDD